MKLRDGKNIERALVQQYMPLRGERSHDLIEDDNRDLGEVYRIAAMRLQDATG